MTTGYKRKWPTKRADHLFLLPDLFCDVMGRLTHQANAKVHRAFDVSVGPLCHKANQLKEKKLSVRKANQINQRKYTNEISFYLSWIHILIMSRE